MTEDEAELVERWNLDQFDGLGFNEKQARALVDAGADPHDVERAVKAGCDLETALLIFL